MPTRRAGLFFFWSKTNMPMLYELRRKPHTSVSAVREYLTCARRYHFKYVRELQPSFKAAASAFGSAWHAVLGHWLTHEGVEHQELEQYFCDDFKERLHHDRVPVLFDDDETEDRLLDTGIKMLRVFLARVPRPASVLGVEVAFSVELAHPKTGELLSVPLIGALDAVVVDAGRKYIWEIKSAKRRWSGDQIEFDIQTTAYGIAARHLGHDHATPRLLIATKGAHPDVQLEDLVRHRPDEDELVELIFGVHAAVNAGVDYRLRGWHCRSCPYAEPCRA